MLGRILSAIAVTALALGAADVQAAALKPDYGPAPSWVEVAPVPAAPAAEGAAAVQVLLDDNQSRLSHDGDAFYNRRIYRILNPVGLEAFKTFSLDWSPETESVTIHAVRILRGGQTIDLLKDGKDMLILRRETNLELAMLDGRMSVTRQIEGLQTGDLIEYAWTQTRRDPVFKGHSYDSEALAFAGVAGRYRVRISWPQEARITWKATEGFGPPKVATEGGRVWLTADLNNAQAPKAPTGAPLRFQRLGSLEVSGFDSWSEVSRLMWPYYEKAMTLAASSPLKAEAAAIARSSADPKVRAFAALQLVEDKTRYLFLGMGEGGYVPAKADETWSRKFGDCKGKTVLLLALLKELGVPAEPVLVNLGGGDGMDERAPSAGAFNHVLVRATLGGRSYWLDGTRAGDRGGLDRVRTPGHRWGLPLRPADADLERIVQPPLETPDLVMAVKLDASRGLDEKAPAQFSMHLIGDAANAMRQGVAAAPRADLERTLRQQLSGSVSWLEVQKIDWRDDPEHDAFDVTLAGVADLDWRKNPDLGVREYKIAPSQTQAGGYPRREPGPNQDAPFAVAYPLFIRAEMALVLPNGGKGFTVRGPNDDEVIGGLELKRSSRIEAGEARFLVDMRSVKPEISAAEAEAATRTLRRLAGEDSLVRAPAS